MHSTCTISNPTHNIHIADVRMCALGRKIPCTHIVQAMSNPRQINSWAKIALQAYLVGGETLHQHIHSHSHSHKCCAHDFFAMYFCFAVRVRVPTATVSIVVWLLCYHLSSVHNDFQKCSPVLLSVYIYKFHARKCDDTQLFPHVRLPNIKNQFFAVQNSCQSTMMEEKLYRWNSNKTMRS